MASQPRPEVPRKERACLQKTLKMLKQWFGEVGYDSNVYLAFKPESDPPVWLLQGRIERKRELMYGEFGQDKANWDQEAARWDLKSEDRLRKFTYREQVHVAIALVPGAIDKPLVGLNPSTGDRYCFDCSILESRAALTANSGTGNP